MIPPGYHSLTPHLTVRGAADAIAFYIKAFGAEELHRSVGPGGEKLIHATLRIGDSMLMLNDEFEEMDCHAPEGERIATTLHLFVEDADAVFRDAVDAGARVVMPVSDMFWGDRYGMVVDPFGHRWAIATRQENLTEDEIESREREYFAQRDSES